MSTGRWDWARVRPCGTPAAYRRHYRRGERPCRACREANSAWRAEWRQKKRRAEDGQRGLS